MFSTNDTIVAIATPVARGAVGIVRLSGPRAADIAGHLIGRTTSLRPRHATFARVGGEVSDQVIVTLFPAPRSYTGEDLVELSAHGSPAVLRSILAAAAAAGARLAEPGEFTLRAFLNGKLDLVQAEAVADLVDAVTPLQARTAFDQLEGTLTRRIAEIEQALFDLIARLEASLDFSEEGYHFVGEGEAAREVEAIAARIGELLAQAGRGRLIRDGAQVAIVGTPNVGKSSLFNALLNAERAIVAARPGTTRDLLREHAEVAGLALSLIDTAGLRETEDEIELEGMSRARQAMAVADVTLLVLDRSRPLGPDDRGLLEDTAGATRVIVANKCDLPSAWGATEAAVTRAAECVELSAATGQGLELLAGAIQAACGAAAEERDAPLVSNVRHGTLLRAAEAALARSAAAIQGAAGQLPEEFVLADLQLAVTALQEVTGARTTDDLLTHIFSRFCVGK